MKPIKTILIMSMLLTCSCGMGGSVNNTTVAKLDLDRYLGTWYEIARYDHSFERGIEYSTAKYTLNEDGSVKVTNSGMKNGKYKESVGKAFLPDPNGEPARLRVSFFGPFYSDYRVLMITDNYQYALVGSKSSKYLWILSRTPYACEETLKAILDEASRRGYDTSKLHWVRQGTKFECTYEHWE